MKKLKELEAVARQLEPDPQLRARWNEAMIRYGDSFLRELPEQPAYQADNRPSEQLARLDIPEEGRPIQDLLALLRTAVDGPGINPASGGHLGYIPGGGLFPTAIGDYLAAITNRYAGIFFGNPGAVRLENHLLRWLCRLVGYPTTALGNLSSGGSIANLIAITTARDKLGIRAARVEKSTVYLTRQVHHCVQKALRIAGLGEAPIRYIPMDEGFRMRPDLLRRQLEEDRANGFQPFLLVGSAGTTDTGAIDPLEELAELAGRHKMWFHVDAAYGGAFLLVESLRPAFRGIERSDSIAIDPHKGLFLSYGIGAVLIRDVEAQYRSHFYQANYMQDAQEENPDWSPADLSPELTKHFRGLRMWLPLQLFGLRPFRAALEEKVLLARYFYEEAPKIGLEVGPPPELSVLLFRYPAPDGEADTLNRQLLHWMQKNGEVFLSSTQINGHFWIRLAVLSFRTHKHTIDRCLQLLGEGLRELSRKDKNPLSEG